VSGPRAGSRIEIVLVAAVADNGVIGRGGALPWRLKSDMLRLRALTWGKPIVVGRTTYLSFTKQPLPGRTNIVVSRNQNFAAPGALVLHFAGGPRLVQLCSAGIVFACAYLGALRAMGVLPPVRAWIPQKTPLLMVREAA